MPAPDDSEIARICSSDLYIRLNLQPGATLQEIKKSYRSLVLRYHPDSARCHPQHKGGDLFRRVQEAFEVLSDKSNRQNYDSVSTPFNGAPEDHPDYDAYSAAFDTEARFNPHAHAEMQEKEELLALAAKYPALSKYIYGVIRENLDSVIYKKSMHVIRPIAWIWPSDIDLARIIVNEGTQKLKRHLIFCILTLPLWNTHIEIVDEIIEQKDPHLARFAAEFMYFQHSINPTGARILSKLLEQDFVTEVMLSLALGGAEFTAHGPSPSNLLMPVASNAEIIKKKAKKIILRKWWDLPEGAELLKRIILHHIPRGDALKAILYRRDIGIQRPHEIERLLRNYPEWVATLKLPRPLEYMDLSVVQNMLIEMESASPPKESVKSKCESKSGRVSAKMKAKRR